jgi:hypothetical protein
MPTLRSHHLNLNADAETVPPQVLQHVLRDPVLLEQLGDRVYGLFQLELKRQRERQDGYGRPI